jgi:adenylosuccinate lyase
MPHTLKALSPLDGRYHKSLNNLGDYFSEYALIKYRIWVEVAYLKALSQAGLEELKLEDEYLQKLQHWLDELSDVDIMRVKEIEKTTNHDVKAVEYLIKEKLQGYGCTKGLELVHLGLTSQDINNTAMPLAMRDATLQLLFPLADELLTLLQAKANNWKDIPMLAQTHGQPASPTLLGKELMVFYQRLVEQFDLLRTIPFAAKFGGATGNFNSLYFAYPEVDWHGFANVFIEQTLQLKRSMPTTQIEHYDHLAAYFDCWKRINTILLDFTKDMWMYISLGYFNQKIKQGEVGSSAMPHKINPIDFENAEGNLGLANALFQHLAAKLPISRLQRDLTDSTVMRNVGVPIGHTVLAFKNILKGMDKLMINETKLNEDLENNWVVVAEGVQTYLKRLGVADPYNMLKELTRGNAKITKAVMEEFVNGLDIAAEHKAKLHELSPFNYIGR